MSLPTPSFAKFACLTALLAIASPALAADEPPKPQPFQHRVFGLFSPDREADLKQTAERIAAVNMNVKLIAVDYAKGMATFEYDPKKEFPGAKPEQVIERLNNLLRDNSNSTFSLQPELKLPREKLQKLELAVVGLDCKACSFAAYQTVMRLEGVEQCEVLFRETRVTAWVDASKIDKAKIEMALKEKGLKIRMPEEAKK